ncbi:Zn-ribbon domain-containing OB-fold protein [Pseudonocardia broussonetiae]|uniref:DNA-binding protein n=1 Tax=Pseudonocardia broussonetiae TaxID=2736640 RepID=A0A6M6JFW0_9PSEU|nr:OB-fold domain-containing protein [Pseudonocardia broussonetiae]QJY46844.1 hypothetical protein HOP40_14290 [Pseudonocardia broussonetiae]
MDVEPHVAALRRGELRVTRCGGCGLPAFPLPRTCPSCGAEDAAEWFTASGRGTLWSFAVFRRTYLPEHPAPYAVLVVELAEGPRLVGAAADGLAPGAPGGLVVGAPVTAEVDARSDPPRVVFRPALPPTPPGPDTTARSAPHREGAAR